MATPLTAQTSGASPEKIASTAIRRVIMPYYLSTIWIPLVSYLWTLYWALEKPVVKRLLKRIQDKIPALSAVELNPRKISGLSKWMKLSIVLLDFLWFILFSVLIVVILVYICNGGLLGWVGRAAVKVGTLGALDFSFCKDLPKIDF